MNFLPYKLYLLIYKKRWLSNHGHILVNGKKCDIPSAQVKVGATVEVKEKSKNLKVINESLEATLNTPAFVDFNKDSKKVEFPVLQEKGGINTLSLLNSQLSRLQEMMTCK